MMTLGEVKEAIELLNADLSQRPNDLSLHARLHKLLLAENYTPRIEDHTEKFLVLLAKSQNWHEALELVDEALARRADWAPRRAESIAPLARAAMQKGKVQLAATLIRGFDKKYPNHPDIPQIYFIGAQLMAERAGRPDEARRILEFLLQRFAADPVATEARRYLEVMDALAAGVRTDRPQPRRRNHAVLNARSRPQPDSRSRNCLAGPGAGLFVTEPRVQPCIEIELEVRSWHRTGIAAACSARRRTSDRQRWLLVRSQPSERLRRRKVLG